MIPYAFDMNKGSWQPGPYAGVEIMVLHKDTTTGGMTILRKFKAGTTVPAHIHPQADESVYILEGQWHEENVVYGPGTFLFVAKGQQHGPHYVPAEVVSLTIFSGPLTIINAA